MVIPTSMTMMCADLAELGLICVRAGRAQKAGLESQGGRGI